MSFEALRSDFYGFENALSAEEKDCIMQLRAFLDAEVRPYANDLWAKAEFFPRTVVEGLAKLGIYGQAWEETRRFENTAVFRGWVALELARVDASVATLVGMQNGLVMGAIAVAGSAEQRAEWLPRFASAEILGAFALTEPLSGSDTAQGLRTVAKREGDSWTINGAKRWIGSGSLSDVTIVWARDADDGQVKGFVVETPAEGYEATVMTGKLSLRAVWQADITLRGVRVPDDNRLVGAKSFRDTGAVLATTRSTCAWMALGHATAGFDAALTYAKQRTQFGRPLASFQIVQQRLVRMLAELTGMQLYCMQIGRLADAGKLSPTVAGLAKMNNTRKAREILAEARDLLGGNGILQENHVMRHMADIEAIHTFEGTETMQTLIVGRDITGISAFT